MADIIRSNERYKKIDYVNKPVSKILYGTVIDKVTGDGFIDLLDEIYGLGINAFDTARVYKGSEELIGRWMEKRENRDNVVILSKCGHHDEDGRKRVNPKCMWEDLKTSCEKLRTDFIDIYLLHRDDESCEVGALVETFNEMHDKGLIGAFGASNWNHRRIEMANEYAYVHNMIPFTVSSPNFGLARQVSDPWGGNCITISGPSNKDARKWYEKNQMPVIAYSSLGRGLFSGRVNGNEPQNASEFMDQFAIKGYGCDDNFERLRRAEKLAKEKGISVSQIAMAWIYNQPVNSFAVVSTSSAGRMKENIAALNIKLSENECRFLNLED